LAKLEIINEALGKLSGSFVLSSLDEDSPHAQQGLLAFSEAGKQLSARHSWSFMFRKRKLENAIRVGDNENFDFSYSYILPEDFGRLLGVFNNDINFTFAYLLGEENELFSEYVSQYEVANKRIYSNLCPLYVTYLASFSADGVYLPEHIHTALILSVRSYCALSLKESPSLSEKYATLFEREVIVAVNADKHQARRFAQQYLPYQGNYYKKF